ncbi:MAG: 2-hydroxyacid dehydrogenase [Ruminococcaceae bacterium]|nr:2-hydroxyacid dehydrogenase [Oscillospiraceae bacterium]
MFLKIAFFDTKQYDRDSFEKFRTDDMVFKYFETKLTPDTVSLAQGFDGICIFVNDTASAEVIDKLYEYGIKFIALRCAGYNNVDIRHAHGKIHIFHVPAYSPYAVAEHTMAMLLTSVRRTHKSYIRTKDFNFSLNGLTGFDLYGKTMGVIGTGKIGRIFINICRGFGMKVIAYDKYPADNSDIEYVTLDEIYEKSDIISLHCPLTRETYHIIDEKAIEKCKKGVIILNTSRGALIDTEALLDGIKSRKIGAACLDVYEEESDVFFEDFSGHIIDDDNLARLISMPNVLVTSHQAFLTEEALNNIAETTVKNITDFLTTGESDNELCQKFDKVETCRKCF